MTVFAEAFGVDAGSVDWRPVLELTHEEREWAEAQWASASGERTRRLLANVSAGEPRRAWPDDRYIEVIRAVRAAHPDLEVRVVGAPSEWERVEAIAAAVDAPAVATPDIEMVIALVATADYVFTPDTSLVHMASAFQKPTVAMFIRDTSAQWGLFETPGVNLESEGMTLDSLPAERVIEALDSLMSVESAAT